MPDLKRQVTQEDTCKTADNHVQREPSSSRKERLVKEGTCHGEIKEIEAREDMFGQLR